jgi:hypothetical protein
MPEALTGLAREVATEFETKWQSPVRRFYRSVRHFSRMDAFALEDGHFGMRAVTFASSARPAQLAERAVAAAERRRASGLIDRCGREGTDVRARARRHTDACS